MINWGTVPVGSVLPFHFASYDGATGASEAITGLAVTDIEVYKGITVTQRSSDAGYALIDTDGIDIDGMVGANGFSIDTGDNTDAGFYVAGSFYTVWVASITADAQTVNFIAGTFRLAPAESSAGVPKVDITHYGGSAGTFSGGRPEVNASHAAGTAWNSGAIGASTLAADTLTAAKIHSDVTTELQSGLATAANLATVAGYLDTEIADIKAKTDNLPTDPADASVLAGLLADLDTLIDAIKAKTDSLTFTVAGQVDSNLQSVNDVALVGDGDATPWGPA